MPPKPRKQQSRGMGLPKTWPENITYLTTPTYTKKFPSEALSALLKRPKDAQDIPASAQIKPCPTVNIKPISTPTHPAYGQFGLFATKSLQPGDFIIQYIGVYHSSIPYQPNQSTPSLEPQPDPHANSNYDLSLDRDYDIGIDADKQGNEARFINDYRGVADRPNAEFREIWDPKRKERGMAVWVMGIGKSGSKGFKGVKKGEEILVSYGKGFWGARKGEGEDGGKAGEGS